MSKTISGVTVKTGGRTKGSLNKRTRKAIEICEQFDFHPAAVLVTIITTGKLPNSDGTFAEVDTQGRLQALRDLCPFVMPRLQAVAQTTTPADAPDIVDLTPLLNDPEKVALAQELVLSLVETAALPAPAPADEAPARDFTEDLQRRADGHWQPK